MISKTVFCETWLQSTNSCQWLVLHWSCDSIFCNKDIFPLEKEPTPPAYRLPDSFQIVTLVSLCYLDLGWNLWPSGLHIKLERLHSPVLVPSSHKHRFYLNISHSSCPLCCRQWLMHQTFFKMKVSSSYDIPLAVGISHIALYSW